MDVWALQHQAVEKYLVMLADGRGVFEKGFDVLDLVRQI